MIILTRKTGGFTLVEMIVSVGLFTVVMFISSSAFLAVLNADRKSRATRIATDNLNLSLEDMSRRIKTGTSYYCGAGGESTGTKDCLTAGTQISFTEQNGCTRTTYVLSGTVINRSSRQINPPLLCSGIPTVSAIAVTAPEIEINNLRFVVGGTASDSIQPYVVILVDGKTKGAVTSSFKIQTMVTQRAYDI